MNGIELERSIGEQATANHMPLLRTRRQTESPFKTFITNRENQVLMVFMLFSAVGLIVSAISWRNTRIAHGETLTEVWNSLKTACELVQVKSSEGLGYASEPSQICLNEGLKTCETSVLGNGFCEFGGEGAGFKYDACKDPDTLCRTDGTYTTGCTNHYNLVNKTCEGEPYTQGSGSCSIPLLFPYLQAFLRHNAFMIGNEYCPDYLEKRHAYSDLKNQYGLTGLFINTDSYALAGAVLLCGVIFIAASWRLRHNHKQAHINARNASGISATANTPDDA